MNPNAIKKLLDRGEVVVLFRNELHSYTAAVVDGDVADAVYKAVEAMDDFALTLTDDYEPSKALWRLSEKRFKTGDYAEWPLDEV